MSQQENLHLLNMGKTKQKNFNEIVNLSQEKNTNDIEQYFSQNVTDTLLPLTNEREIGTTIRGLIKNIEADMPTENDFSIKLGRMPDASAHSKKIFMISDKSNEKIIDISDVAGTSPRFKADPKFSATVDIFNPGRKKWLYYDEKMLQNEQVNKSPFVAYLTRLLGFCKIWSKTYGYSKAKETYISWLFATHICNDLIKQGFPVLDGFGTRENFNDFINLNILKDYRHYKNKFQNLLSQEEVAKVLKTEEL